MGKLVHLAHRLRRRLFDSRTRSVSDSESYASPLCQSLLQIQDHPLLAFSAEYLIPYQIAFEAVARKPADSYVVIDSNRHEFVELRIRNDVLCPEIREIWSLDGRRRIAFACRKRWGKDWTLYLPSGAAVCQLAATANGYAALLPSTNEVISVQMHCNCGGPCFILHRGDNHHAGRTIALVIARPDKNGFVIIVAPFVDVLLILAISSCIWKMSRRRRTGPGEDAVCN